MNSTKYLLLFIITCFLSCKSEPGKLISKQKFSECTFSVYSIKTKNAPDTVVITVENKEVTRKEILRIGLGNGQIDLSSPMSFTFLKHKDREYSLIVPSNKLLCYKIDLNYSLDAEVISCIDAAKGSPALKEELFTTSQNEDWMIVKGDWENLFFYSFIEKNKFKLDCINCNTISLKLEIKVDQEGNCTDVSVIDKKIDCKDKSEEQKKNLEEEMINYLKGIRFPSLLRDMKIEVTIGDKAKC